MDRTRRKDFESPLVQAVLRSVRRRALPPAPDFSNHSALERRSLFPNESRNRCLGASGGLEARQLRRARQAQKASFRWKAKYAYPQR